MSIDKNLLSNKKMFSGIFWSIFVLALIFVVFFGLWYNLLRVETRTAQVVSHEWVTEVKVKEYGLHIRQGHEVKVGGFVTAIEKRDSFKFGSNAAFYTYEIIDFEVCAVYKKTGRDQNPGWDVEYKKNACIISGKQKVTIEKKGFYKVFLADKEKTKIYKKVFTGANLGVLKKFPKQKLFFVKINGLGQIISLTPFESLN